MPCRLFFVPVFLAALGCVWPVAHAGDGFQSGPAPGRIHGGSFQSFTVNGKKGSDRFHCPVLEFDLKPVLAIFVRESDDHPTPDEAAVQELLKKADEAVKNHDQTSSLQAFALWVTPAAHSSINQAKIEVVDKLIEQSQAREKLTTRLEELAKPYDRVLVGYVAPEQVERWELSKEPGVTVVLYAKHKVLENIAFPEGKLKNEDVERILKSVEERIK